MNVRGIPQIFILVSSRLRTGCSPTEEESEIGRYGIREHEIKKPPPNRRGKKYD